MLTLRANETHEKGGINTRLFLCLYCHFKKTIFMKIKNWLSFWVELEIFGE